MKHGFCRRLTYWKHVCPVGFQKTMICGLQSAFPQQSQQDPGQEPLLRSPPTLSHRLDLGKATDAPLSSTLVTSIAIESKGSWTTAVTTEHLQASSGVRELSSPTQSHRVWGSQPLVAQPVLGSSHWPGTSCSLHLAGRF